MPRPSEGHPLAALLLLFSMFAFAFVFHAVTRQPSVIPARFDVQLTALAGAVDAERPLAASTPATRRSTPPAAAPASLPAEREVSVEEPPVAAALAPVAASFSWPAAPALLRAPVASRMPAPASIEDGAVTRAFIATSSALRSALKKTF